MKRFIFFLRAYSNHHRVQLVLLLLLEKLKIFSNLIEKNFNHSFVESRRILGFVYDCGGTAKSFANGMNLDVMIANHGRKFHLRWNSSDFLVFEQVIVRKEYYPIIELANKHKLNIKTIIDAGGNIGCTSIFLKSYFQHAKIISIEPDRKNFEALKSNILSNRLNVDVHPHALWSELTKVSLSNNHLDMRDWSVKVSAEGDLNVSTTTLKKLFNELAVERLDVLKMDIEGAEINIFLNDQDLSSVLKKTSIIAIEIHSEEGKQLIQSALKNWGFQISHQQETFFGINQNMINAG